MREADRIIGAKLLRGTPFSTARRGVDVVLKVGGNELVLHPDTAIDIAMGLYQAARLAKTHAGLAPIAHGIADLTDGTAEARKLEKTRDGSAVFGLLRPALSAGGG